MLRLSSFNRMRLAVSIVMSVIIPSSVIANSNDSIAAERRITSFRHSGELPVAKPLMIDSLDVNSKSFAFEQLLDMPFNSNFGTDGVEVKTEDGIVSKKSDAFHLLETAVSASCYSKANIKVEGLKQYKLFVDGKQSSGNDVVFLPGSHQIVVRCFVERDSVAHPSIVLSGKDADRLSTDNYANSLYNINNVLEGERLRMVRLSASGRYMITTLSTTFSDGKANWYYRLTDVQTGRVLNESDKPMTWLPGEDRYYTTRRGLHGTQIIAHNPADGKETVICEQAPDEAFYFLSSSHDKLIVNHRSEGPKDDKDVHEYITPDDRQPGWRNRNNLLLFDIKTCQTTPLTYGHHNVHLNDISQDGKKLLISVSDNRYGKRPTSLTTLLLLDIETMTADTIIRNDGYFNWAHFSPDGKQLVVKGSAEAFGGIGKNLPEGRIPNAFDYQLFVVDIKSKSINPITKFFNPSIEQFEWNNSDGLIYFTANDRDCVNMFVSNPKKNFEISRIDLPEEVITNIAFAKNKPTAAIIGESASNSDRLYSLDLRSLKPKLLADLSATRLKGISLGKCEAWDFVNSRGDTICGRYYLPPNFDRNRKYPMIVYYYGGCSPVPRDFETRYPFHAYAAQDYVVYVLQPSGCAGFGQEFASRHVNTAGQGPAEDIIEGTKKFAEIHSFVDDKKIGCMGASYGGFMTQYLQTQTDIFAAAISHAGISDHTSYWGEGYWGYSYSEVSMANSYPWTRKDLYVDQSPLFNADKIHTPLLFLHGTADTNVPVGESIQMYTALKLLGCPTALVVVEGENHGINEFSKRMKWQQTIYAWFARWLKDDSGWWDSMYPQKEL